MRLVAYGQPEQARDVDGDQLSGRPEEVDLGDLVGSGRDRTQRGRGPALDAEAVRSRCRASRPMSLSTRSTRIRPPTVCSMATKPIRLANNKITAIRTVVCGSKSSRPSDPTSIRPMKQKVIVKMNRASTHWVSRFRTRRPRSAASTDWTELEHQDDEREDQSGEGHHAAADRRQQGGRRAPDTNGSVPSA